MKAIGCLEEGILRNHMPTAQGGRRDSIVLSILKKEWFEGEKKPAEKDPLKISLYLYTGEITFPCWGYSFPIFLFSRTFYWLKSMA